MEELFRICQKYRLQNTDPAPLIPESYLPYIPQHWNGILILAEAQNHSLNNQGYVDWLKSLKPGDRIKRLYLRPDLLGVYPWDDGSLKLAALSLFPDEGIENFAVGNAVLWSIRKKNGSNASPTDDMIESSVHFWRDLFHLWCPKLVICAGKIAGRVIEASWTNKRLLLRLPAKTAMSRVSGMFDEEDLLQRYPEVARAYEKHRHIIRGGHSRNKIFFACHAISIAKSANA